MIDKIFRRASFRCLATFLFVVVATTLWSDDAPKLRVWLKDGSFMDGQLMPSERDGFVKLNSPVFGAPMEIDIRVLRSVAGDYSPPQPKDGHLFLLEGGTRISGKLKSWDKEAVVIDSKSLGAITLDRSLLRVIEALEDTGKRIYSGPKSIDDWTILDNTGKWTFAAGALTSPDNEAKAAGNVKLPDRFRLSLSMSWEGRADFVLSLGCKQPKKPQPVQQQNRVRRAMVHPSQDAAAVRLEMWDAQLAVVREVGNLADIAVLPLDDGISKFQLTFYVDQVEGLVAVYSPRGKLLEKIQVAKEKGSSNAYALLENHGKSVSLDQFDVFEWDGHLPDSTEYPDGYVLTKDDEVLSSTVVGFDGDKGELFLVSADDKESTLAMNQVRRVIIVDKAKGKDSKERGDANEDSDSDGDAQSKDESKQEKPDALDTGRSKLPLDEARLIEVDFADASRLVGYLVSAGEKGTPADFYFKGDGIAGRFDCQADQIVAISGAGMRFTPPPLLGVSAWLQTESAKVQGCLVDSDPKGKDVLVWQSYGSDSRVPLRRTINGEIKFNHKAKLANPRVNKLKNRVQQAEQATTIPALAELLEVKVRPTSNADGESQPAYEIVFRSGDSVDGTVQSANEQEIKFHSTETSTTTVGHDKMDSLTLSKMKSKPDFDEEELKRLLTVPRSNKNDPPTHLFVSTTGDYLRGRLIGIDDKSVAVEIRLSVQEIPREKVARVIWLHDRPWLDDKKEDEQPEQGDAGVEADATREESPFLVHAVRFDKRGVTFAPKRLQDNSLSGESTLLGQCNVQLNSIASLIFGDGLTVGDKALALRKESWTLSLAALPKAYLETPAGESEINLGKQSPLVGKDAPEIKLQTIDDVEFVLSENRDKVVVLDFWASWCGPCIATMPKVDQIVKKFDPHDVELVAVNLQDSVERARIALKRMEIEPTVIMDVDGEAAQFYDARAIPQTVIVDTKGKITHVFVGGGSKFLTQFETALKETLGQEGDTEKL